MEGIVITILQTYQTVDPLFCLQRPRTHVKCAAGEKVAPALPSSRPMAVFFSFAKENPALWASVTGT